MTFGEMKTQVMSTLGLQDLEDYDEGVFVERDLNRGVIDLLSRTRCVVRCVHLRTQAGVDTYTLDHAILSLVEVGDSDYRARRDEWPRGNSLYPPELWRNGFTLIRSDVLRIPAPQEDGEIDVWAVMRPTKMTAPEQSPGEEQYGAIPEEFQDAIVLYALWKGADYADDATAQMGDRYRIQYEGQDTRSGRLREIRLMVNKRGTARAPRSRGRTRRVSSRRAWIG